MNQVLSKPYILLFVTGAIVLLISFLFPRQTIDIHLHDTFIVIDKRTCFIALAIAVALLGGLYILCAPALRSGFLTWLHIAVTVLGILGLVVIGFLQPVPPHDPNYSQWANFEQFAVFNKWVATGVMVLLLSQLAFLINIIIGVVKIIGRS